MGRGEYRWDMCINEIQNLSGLGDQLKVVYDHLGYFGSELKII
jgi:hypothetical protein